MAPPDGTRAPRIPTLSWDSVVDSGPPSEPSVDSTTTPVEPIEPTDSAGQAGLTPISLDLDGDVAPAPTPPAPVAPVAPVAPPAPIAPAAPAAPPTPASPAPLAAPIPAAEPSPPADLVRTSPPTAIVPAIGDVTAGPASIAPATDSDELPTIREATPPPQPSGPLLPSAAPAVQRPPSAFEFDPASVAGPPVRQPLKRKRHTGLKLLVTLVLLGGLVAAGVVFGQPYLFPSEWDDATAPYAEAVETSSGDEFIEPLSITSVPSADLAARVASRLAPASPQQAAEWRALGLATGIVDAASLTGQLAGWSDVVYSTDDGQVYRDAGAAGPGLDAQLVQAMAAASLDQQFGWSADRSQQSLDAAVSTSAEVLRQASAIQRSSTFPGPIEPAPIAQLAGLPSIVAYQLRGPQVIAEFPSDDEPNALIALGATGRASLGDAATAPPSLPVLADGDVITESPVIQDRSFWFLVFGGLLDGTTAFAASEAVVENSIVHATRGTTDCVYATFSGGGVDETAVLRSALEAWTLNAPAEFASSFSVAPNGSLQLSSCDPGPEFATPVRSTVVDELVAYRSLELATAEAVALRGGGEPEFAYVWGLVKPSTMPADVTAVATVSTPVQVATAANDALSALFNDGS